MMVNITPAGTNLISEFFIPIHRMATMSSTTNMRKSFRRQKLDHRNQPVLSDPVIARDPQLYDILKQAIRANLLRTNTGVLLKIALSLYRRYRGTGFPLTRKDKTSFPR